MAIKLTGNPTSIEQTPEEEPKLNKKGKPKKSFYLGNLLITLSGIALGIMGAMALVPLLTFFAGVVAAIFFALIILGASLFTLFIIWGNPEFKSFVDGYSEFLGKLFKNEITDVFYSVAKSIYLYLLIIGLFILLTTLIYCIIKKKKDDKKSAVKTGQLIASIIMLILFIVASVFCYFFLKAI